MKFVVRHLAPRSRRGIAVLFVLAMLAATLTISFALLRVQTSTSAVEYNVQRQLDARLAALTGMNVALRKMHGSAWSGVGTSINGTVKEGVTYVAEFRAGDTRLTATSADFALNPYRVTITSTGYAATVGQSHAPSTYKIESVVQLIPRALQSTPSEWARVQNHTVFQWSDKTLLFELPAQLSGNVHAQGQLSFAPTYPVENLVVFQGNIDEVAIYNKALTATDVLAIQNATLGLLGDSPVTRYASHGPIAYWRLNDGSDARTATDQQGTYPGEYVSAKSNQSAIPFTGAGTSAYFDGVTDSIHCGKISPSGDKLTVLAWFNATSFSSTKRCLVANSKGSANAEQLWTIGTFQNNGINGLYFNVRSNGQTTTLEATSLTLLPGTWAFAAAVYDGSKMRLFLNGLQIGETSCSGSINGDANAFVSIGDWTPGSPRSRLLKDYRQMQLDGVADYRPSSLTWNAPSGMVPTADKQLLTDDLAVSVVNVATNRTPPVTFPITAPKYQLYAGGPVYTVPTLSGALSNNTLKPDVQTNPLGIFQCKSDLRFSGNVAIQGSILLTESTINKVELEGDNLTWTPVDLPLLSGETLARQLPIIITPGMFKIKDGSTGNVLRGLILAGDKAEFGTGANDMKFELKGSLVAHEIQLQSRTNWSISADDWRNYVRLFLQQRSNANGIKYFPQWLAAMQGYECPPQFAVTPDVTGRIYHWPDFSRPFFEKHPADEGLRWKVVAWYDGVK